MKDIRLWVGGVAAVGIVAGIRLLAKAWGLTGLALGMLAGAAVLAALVLPWVLRRW